MNYTEIRGRHWIASGLIAVALAAGFGGDFATVTYACGGFFCQLVPIDQAGEQIIFRQDGTTVTAIVLIQYQGDADDFSWVLPVPGVPEFELASDLVFSPLEQASRPRFNLTTVGEGCGVPLSSAGDPSAAPADDAVNDNVEDDDGVEVLKTLVVGPFEIQLVSSDDPAAMAEWLEDNDYDLTDRGEELITPYVEEGMNFVAMRLLQDQGVGDIQPLKLVYQSETPMIPLRLTAVAAVPDMGILVWMLGDARAVSLNYLHLDVNYTRLEWYRGTSVAYADYQDLVTEAMDEAGGQGFVTDYAGTDLDVVSQLPDPDDFRDELVRVGNLESDQDFYSQLYSNFLFDQDKVLEVLRRQLPLPEGQDEVAYAIPSLLEDVLGSEVIAAARTPIINELIDSIVQPLEATLEVFDGMPYMTRLFTTLSPEEMTVDPIFSFNPDLERQQLDREATMTRSCVSGETHWELTLGEGTGRDGELVIRGVGEPSFSGAPEIAQSAVARSLRLGVSGEGEVVTDNDFETALVGEATPKPAPIRPFFGLCGAGFVAPLAAGSLWLLGVRLNRRSVRTRA